jgi:peptidoglycan hydrolase CwlO-like protein
LLEQEEKVNKANVTAMELLGQLKEADAEIEHLRAQVGELQGKVKNL